jgi:hypothetical protein
MEKNGNEACIRSVGPCAAMEQKSIQQSANISKDDERIQKVHILVYGENQESAIIRAQEIMHQIGYYHQGVPFHYYIDFKYYLKQLWTEHLSPVLPILQVTTSSFPTQDLRGLDLVNKIMEDINSELIQRSFIVKAESNRPEICSIASDPANYGVRLYDFAGNLISSPEHLRCLLNPSDKTLLSLDQGSVLYRNWGPHVWKQPLWLVTFALHSYSQSP